MNSNIRLSSSSSPTLLLAGLVAVFSLSAFAQVTLDERDSRRGAPYYNNTDGIRLSDEERTWRYQEELRREQFRQQRDLTRQDDLRQRQADEPIGQRALREQEENRRQQGRAAVPGSFGNQGPAVVGTPQPVPPQRPSGVPHRRQFP